MVRFSTRMNLLKGSAIRELLALANKPEILSRYARTRALPC